MNITDMFLQMALQEEICNTLGLYVAGAPDELDLEMFLVKYVCLYHFHLTGRFPNIPV